MGGFHLVEPVEGNPGTEQVAISYDVVNGAEKGPAPPGHVAKPMEGRVTILTVEMLEVLAKDPEFEIQVTEADIAGRSKGDTLVKVIFILQSTWFVAQCVARSMQGLSLTQLELTTLTLASLNGIAFILWWDKPLGSSAIVRVHLKRKLTDAERNVEGVSASFAGSSILTGNCSEVNPCGRV